MAQVVVVEGARRNERQIIAHQPVKRPLIHQTVTNLQHWCRWL